MKDNSPMTYITGAMYERATSPTLSLKSAVATLRENANVRTTLSILSKFTGIPEENAAELQSHLIERIMATSPTSSRDTVRRKVSMWIKNEVTISKDGAVLLAFALRLSVDEADLLLKYTTEEGFHWRSVDDVIYTYSLSHGLTYEETQDLKKRLSEKGLVDFGEEGDADTYTEQIKSVLLDVRSEKELEEFLSEFKSSFGKFHNTAYRIFEKLLSLLRQPEIDELYLEGLTDSRGDTSSEAELCTIDSYSIRDVLRIYMYDSLVPHGKEKRQKKDSDAVSLIQRSIKQSWPDETALSKMQHREIDVTRKVLILLFLATDGYEDAEDYDIDLELDKESVFEDTYMRLDNMLVSSGFSRLDARAPFDWMVLYCICTDDSILIDERIRAFLTRIFEKSDS